jgi:hypothetical protein
VHGIRATAAAPIPIDRSNVASQDPLLRGWWALTSAAGHAKKALGECEWKKKLAPQERERERAREGREQKILLLRADDGAHVGLRLVGGLEPLAGPPRFHSALDKTVVDPIPSWTPVFNNPIPCPISGPDCDCSCLTLPFHTHHVPHNNNPHRSRPDACSSSSGSSTSMPAAAAALPCLLVGRAAGGPCRGGGDCAHGSGAFVREANWDVRPAPAHVPKLLPRQQLPAHTINATHGRHANQNQLNPSTRPSPRPTSCGCQHRPRAAVAAAAAGGERGWRPCGWAPCHPSTRPTRSQRRRRTSGATSMCPR